MTQVPGVGAEGEVVDRLLGAIGADPVVALAILLVAIAVGLLVLLVVRRLFITKGVALSRALGRRDRVVVLMHPNPDPDAMAAAVGVARLAELAGTTAVVQYPGQIRHQENRAFRTVLDLDFERIEAVRDLAAEDVVLVDHNVPRGFEGAEWLSPYAVIDHHPGDGTGAVFTDVRPDYGACATIVAEYFRDVGARPGRDAAGGGPLTTTVATGLLYGILADTAHLTRGCAPAEFTAASFLYPAVDEDALDRIANPQVDQEILDVISTAIAQRDVRGPYTVSDVGELSNLDAIPQAADQLLALEGITAVVVLGEKDRTLHVSGRSRDDRVHMGNVLKAVAADLPLAQAGGHARMGGGQLPLEEMETGYGPSGGTSREQLREHLFDALAGDV